MWIICFWCVYVCKNVGENVAPGVDLSQSQYDATGAERPKCAHTEAAVAIHAVMMRILRRLFSSQESISTVNYCSVHYCRTFT